MTNADMGNLHTYSTLSGPESLLVNSTQREGVSLLQLAPESIMSAFDQFGARRVSESKPSCLSMFHQGAYAHACTSGNSETVGLVVLTESRLGYRGARSLGSSNASFTERLCFERSSREMKEFCNSIL